MNQTPRLNTINPKMICRSGHGPSALANSSVISILYSCICSIEFSYSKHKPKGNPRRWVTSGDRDLNKFHYELSPDRCGEYPTERPHPRTKFGPEHDLTI